MDNLIDIDNKTMVNLDIFLLLANKDLEVDIEDIKNLHKN
jgi:hypothetical protein